MAFEMRIRQLKVMRDLHRSGLMWHVQSAQA